MNVLHDPGDTCGDYEGYGDCDGDCATSGDHDG